MTKHDTWVKLKPGNPYESVLDLFREGLPVRYSFPLERVTAPDGKQVPLWIIDKQRLSPMQMNAVAQLIALVHNTDLIEVQAEAASVGGFGMADGYIQSMHCDAEGLQRSKEPNILFRELSRAMASPTAGIADQTKL